MEQGNKEEEREKRRKRRGGEREKKRPCFIRVCLEERVVCAFLVKIACPSSKRAQHMFLFFFFQASKNCLCPSNVHRMCISFCFTLAIGRPKNNKKKTGEKKRATKQTRFTPVSTSSCRKKVAFLLAHPTNVPQTSPAVHSDQRRLDHLFCIHRTTCSRDRVRSTKPKDGSVACAHASRMKG